MYQPTKVGPITYNVCEIAGLMAEDNEKLDGWLRNSKEVIYIEEDMGKSYARTVLWEEILHAILVQSGHECLDNVVRALSYGIDQVLLDNPWLRKHYGR